MGNNTQDIRAFSKIPFTSEPTPKPRTSGISEICDWGIPLGELTDYLEHTGPYVDVAKIVLGYGAIYPLKMLKKKRLTSTTRQKLRCSRVEFSLSMRQL